MAKNPILGHVACPTCAEQMAVRHDKNGDPFGFCEEGCGQQLRVGGSPMRVRAFIKRYPWAGKVAAPAAAPTPVTVTEPEKPAPAPAIPEKKTVTVTEPAKPVTRTSGLLMG